MSREELLLDLHRFSIELLPYVTARVANREDAADVLQIALLGAVLAFDRPGFEARDPRAYFRGIVRRRLARYYRCRRSGESSDAVTIGVATKAPSPEADAISAEVSVATVELLEQLRPKDREVLTRFYLNEETKEEICRTMRITLTQFRLLKSRALDRFGVAGRLRAIENFPLAEHPI
jgi:RNA polymerase sigma factor (sigma-70 family)